MFSVDWLTSRSFDYTEEEMMLAKQKKWYDLVLRSSLNNEQLLLIVNGTAGTGKSFTVAAITGTLGPNVVGRAAFTAKAAHLIHGRTLHGMFKLPTGRRNFTSLKGESLKSLQESLKDLKVLIIDEFSMLSQGMLDMVDRRLKQVFNSNSSFGGVSVILVGDISQLPPVSAIPLYKEPSNMDNPSEQFSGYFLYKSFTKVILLEKTERQLDNGLDPDQSMFIKTLASLRNGDCSVEEWKFLMKWTPQQNRRRLNDFLNAVRLFSTNEKVDAYNAKQLRRLNQPVLLSLSQNSSAAARRMDSSVFRGLEHRLLLCLNARITLVANIWSEVGLTNGALGTIRDIVFSVRRKMGEFPDFIIVEFDSYSGPSFFSDPSRSRFIPIWPIAFKSDDFRHERTQFPVRLAYAMTIHKSQGQTLEKAIIDLGEKEPTAGLSFVALSRVKSIHDLLIEPCPYSRLSGIKDSKVIAERRDEELRLRQLAIATEI